MPRVLALRFALEGLERSAVRFFGLVPCFAPVLVFGFVMEGVKRIAEALGLSPSKIDFGQATCVAEGWWRIPLQNMPDIEGVAVYCLTDWDRPKKKMHGCHILWAFLHIWRGHPVAGTSIARQAGHADGF